MIDPYESGYEDAIAGFGLCENPYEFGTDSYGTWRQGFMDACNDYGD